MDADPKLEQVIRQIGAKLEAACRDAGSPLPPGLSGASLVRELLEESESRHRSPEGQVRAKQLAELAQQVATALPGGYKDPEYVERLQVRLKEFFDQTRDGPTASA